MVKIENVSVAFDGCYALKSISVTLHKKRIGIIGSNGSGKSTFARLINGLQLPSEGKVHIDHLSTDKDGKAIRRKVGFVFQNPDHQIIFPIVEDDMAFGLKNIGYNKEAINQTIDALLNAYGATHLRYRKSHLLSGGEKQLLAILAVLVMQPAYIVFDEPTTLLDLSNKRKILQMIAKLDQTIIMVTHDLDLLAHFDRVLVFEQGCLVIDDIPSVSIKAYQKLIYDQL
ncbi:MAG: energy-coupling factor ABC transporter ATP-binding protein [Candidatus Cardinium sp.]|uniref:energy-coupling factor ABC transporter ATP-binding protein n=1 Tax=Cardinium endosymbiont of Dermatophagoides farinae TaxID=2597823 RepID=UPI0011840174|nr:ABC transporter ATP-binding protein [Cardinium endosymbiont of Dermatophagoides farinae]TSJ80801.1 ABC transporter ATP-binding protein [Cardinium endosymbiont of Dermatophagoides farinae]UWW96804.1 MAG: energy-coupling factor ABC transporter ATP-binding protein [Candidatus Cardinium sp.]